MICVQGTSYSWHYVCHMLLPDVGNVILHHWTWVIRDYVHNENWHKVSRKSDWHLGCWENIYNITSLIIIRHLGYVLLYYVMCLTTYWVCFIYLVLLWCQRHIYGALRWQQRQWFSSRHCIMIGAFLSFFMIGFYKYIRIYLC